MALRARFATILALTVLALVACGGRTLELPGDSEPLEGYPSTWDSGTHPTPSPSATATSPVGPSKPGDPFPICPEKAPKVGEACATHGQGCAYVDYDKGTCISFTCDAKGTWQSSTPAGC